MTSAQPLERKLAVILAADVAGYSRLMGIDEETTLATLSAYRKIIDTGVDMHSGRIFGSAGDSVLAEFSSPVEAVRAAIEIQEKLHTCNTDLGEAQRMRFRMGINLGDVIVEDNNLLGDGVNVAARLEGMARPGGLCVSAAVFEQVRDRLDLDFIDLGEHTVKNIARPVRVYRVPLVSEYHPVSPFRGLAVFDIEHAEFFHGRSDAISAAKIRLEQQALTGQEFLLIYGMSGVGKSSLARAGLLPALIQPETAAEKKRRYAILHPSQRTSPLAALGAALFTETALPELAQTISVEELEQSFRQTPDKAIRTIQNTLADTTVPTPLILLIDQLEELFTAEQIDNTAQEQFVDVLKRMAESGFIRIIATLRSDFFHRCAEIPGLAELKDGLGSFELLPPSAAEIGEIIRQPAQATGLRFEDDTQEGRLDEVLQQAAARDPASLPLLEFTLDALYETGKTHRVLNFADYHALGGLEGAISRRADEVLDSLPVQIQSTLPAVLSALVTVKQGEAGATACAVPFSELTANPTHRRLIDALIDARLVVSSRDADNPVLRLAHEALLSHWPRAREIIAADYAFLETRSRIRNDQQRWQNENRSPELLLPPGRRLAESEELLSERREELDQALIAYIEASLDAARRSAQKTLNRTRSFAVAMAILALLAGIGGYLGYTGQRTAELRVVEIDKEKKRAEQLANLAEQRAEEARLAREQAEHNATLAQEQTQLAEQRAEQFRVASVVSNVVSAVSDPATQALLLAALRDTSEPRNGIEIARRILNQTIPRSILHSHQGTVTSLAFSADGTRVASAGDDGGIRLWSSDGRGEPELLKGHAGIVRKVLFSPDGRLLASAGDDATVRLWALDGDDKPRVFKGHEKSVREITFNPDGSLLASAGSDATVRLWTLDNMSETLVLRNHKRGVTSISFSPDSTLLASASHDATVRLWSVRDGAEVRVFKGHTRSVRKAIFSPDSAHIASAGRDGTVRLWSVDDAGEPWVLQSREHVDPLRGIAFSPDGSMLAGAGDAGMISVWTLTESEIPRLLQGHTDWISNLVFSPDGAYLASAGGDGTVRLWSVDDNFEPLVLQGHKNRITNITFSRDSRHLASADGDSTIRVWPVDLKGEPQILKDSKSGIALLRYSFDGARLIAYGEDATIWTWAFGAGNNRTLALLNYESAVRTPELSPDNKYLLAGSRDDGTVRVWAVDGNGEPLWILQGSEGRVTQALFSPDDKLLASIGADDTVIRIWTLDTNTHSLVLKGHKERIRNIVFSPDSTRLASASQDGTVRVWNVNGDNDPVVLQGHEGWITSVIFSPDGSRIVSAGYDGTVRVWPSDGSRPPLVLQGHEHAVGKVILSPDGKLLVSADINGTLLVRTSDDSEAKVFEGHMTGARQLGSEDWFGGVAFGQNLTFSPDSKLLASAGDEGGIRIWATDGGDEPLLLPSYKQGARILTFSTDGRRLASAYYDGTVRLWTLHWDDLLARLAASTTACLTPGQRIEYLFESAATARAAYETCERAHGRTPQPEQIPEQRTGDD